VRRVSGGLAGASLKKTANEATLRYQAVGTHADSVHDQFDPRGPEYLSSRVHAAGPDLDHAEHLVAQALSADAWALDVGCGAGHLSFRLASRVRHIVAADASAGMLATVARECAARGLGGIETCEASAESLPFDNGRFDLVASRYSAHHWTHLGAAMLELRRVTRRGGFLLLIDALAPEEALSDTHLQAMELLRDRSHVRDRSVSEWKALLSSAGFELLEHRQWPVRIEFAAWIRRMSTPPEYVAAIRSLQRTAPAEVQRALRFEPDGSFELRAGLFWAGRGA
jgi:ubiquinone/menaquinone biosynthesis C-methylase UbiE